MIRKIGDGAMAAFPEQFAGACETAVVIGSGLTPGDWPGEVVVSMDYGAIAGMAVPGVEGHPGRLVLLDTGAGRLIVFEGRTHLYEGAGWKGAGSAASVAAGLGCRRIVLTQAAGSLRRSLPVGSWLVPYSVLSLPWGDGTDIRRRNPAGRPSISPNLRKRLELACSEAGLPAYGGILYWTAGPAYETPAEAEAAALAGADAATMSPMPELSEAAVAGIDAACLSFITNFAPNVSGSGTGHATVLERGGEAASGLSRLLPLLAGV